ncbi:MAG: NAD(P)-dependent oxidoreductase [Spirochaetia bacterium]
MLPTDFTGLPATIETEEELEELMSTPPPGLIRLFSELDGDVMVLGVGGKMGTQLAGMARRAAEEAGAPREVIGVSRFSTPGKREQLEAAGVRTIACDLLDRAAVAALPDASNIIFMAGRKFGTSGSAELTWAMNTLLPALVAERFPESRTVVFSTGNVYPLVPVTGGGARETDEPAPVGEYAITTLGRERVFEYYSKQNSTPVCLMRLNYAIDLRYGVLYDIGMKVRAGETIDLTMGNANVIWQGDAVAHALYALTICASPARILNVTGPEIMSIRWAAETFAKLMGTEARFVGEESGRALIGNASDALGRFGYPRVPLQKMVEWTAHWIEIGGPSLSKPTHFETSDGSY